ncbi:MAG TPA: carbamoyltransferase HypF [Thermoplasmata archaeon]|nr:carbamoyltransferase HypF [Thermoplasmata archaeon]
MRAEIRVYGIVQGVGFRPFVYRNAVEHDLKGWVVNLGDSSVKIVVEGEKNEIKSFISDIETKKPPLARVNKLKVKEEGKGGGSGTKESFGSFKILPSKKDSNSSTSMIPADISICDECAKELITPTNRRFDYFFITCTNCGPRYSIIREVPYDRERTSMDAFPMCEECSSEYKDPMDRRYHAQTVACDRCGPKAWLQDSENKVVECKSSADSIRLAGKLLTEGNLIAVKGYGGFHLACNASDSKAVSRLRKLLVGKGEQPFALMARNLETINKFARVNKREETLLTSWIKPIVILEKKPSSHRHISPLVAPGLHNVGVMLPYSGLHLLLFQQNNTDAFVLTSANKVGEPMIMSNEEAVGKLGKKVDYFLVYEREILHRCDDSVMRLVNDQPTLLRRSRGYAPMPVQLARPVKNCVLAVGGELNVAGCLLKNDKAFLTPYVGNTSHWETFQFLSQTIDHLLKLAGCSPQTVACDLHPTFNTTRFAEDWSASHRIPLFRIQHHHAHVAGLMGEWNLEEVIAIAVDGFGYGSDGQAWGGEVFYSDRKDFERLCWLEKQPMAGGDLAAYYPLRMTGGMLNKFVEKEELTKWLNRRRHYFPHEKEEIGLLIKQLENEEFLPTTSCGRVLDAVSALLGVCHYRSYEGEPAMRLEAAAVGGEQILKLKPQIEKKEIKSTPLMEEIWKKRGACRVKDLAYSAEDYLAESFATAAVEKAMERGVGNIGVTGGCACNNHLVKTMKNIIEDSGLNFFQHRLLPPGDGGVSFGQALIADWRMEERRIGAPRN